MILSQICMLIWQHQHSMLRCKRPIFFLGGGWGWPERAFFLRGGSGQSVQSQIIGEMILVTLPMGLNPYTGAVSTLPRDQIQSMGLIPSTTGLTSLMVSTLKDPVWNTGDRLVLNTYI